ncbi:TRAP transporter small permease subunit [Thiomicrorhabdus heinhorstiae]|uniref:TRAP transporter small permease protein n=1 Tax=Thiomicrorhabdus heinhorstiae TaxID=2748010 RepID=A0ABS0BZL6_9GAMM|nr:TRAP transporter small permease subunit [Thiomicrorhabdus heinhorstiae]MBF6057436.1 TRAP transporter small permease subunit [Thiomicrorhabdus heinhorstiae]
MANNSFLLHFVLKQNSFQNRFGNLVAWGTLSLVLITALVVILRYGFDSGSIALQESIMYNHALIFMLGIAYTYQQDQHVRVDIFYGRFSERKKALVNLVGTLVLTLPVMIYLAYASWDYIVASWQIHEGSADAGGLGYVFLLKTLILVLVGLLGLQALSIAAESWLKLQGVQIAHQEHAEGKL